LTKEALSSSFQIEAF